ncbi:IS110 family transposase [Arenibacter sp. GZD96]|uniref:IS110 family transposase n=1 Tax=Aurantibrevibacter litoralis TaxID=3106030 RepID=UPI002B00B19B|nr:IS110 family transposase [Arenibacter sp. GZD-96]MEA1786101.1 IS110 family transposase [Arenibacter sp. GZD-96]
MITSNESLGRNYALLTGIRGIGRQTAIMAIVYTGNFTKFDCWRKFASYCGVAPFEFSSGTSVKARTRVSHLANRQLKAMLHLCALSSIRFNTEMRLYYEKRTLEGRNKMSTLNIIRNKLIARMFAVVKRGSPYVDNLKYAA